MQEALGSIPSIVPRPNTKEQTGLLNLELSASKTVNQINLFFFYKSPRLRYFVIATENRLFTPIYNYDMKNSYVHIHCKFL